MPVASPEASLSQMVEDSTRTAEDPTGRLRHWGGPDVSERHGNGRLRLLGVVTVVVIGAIVAWDLRRRGLPALRELGEFAPHLLLAAPLLAGLGMLAGRRPPTWAGLLVGAGTWSVLGAVWSGRWLVDAAGKLLDGSPDPKEFATGLTWVPYVALVVLGLVVLVTVLVLRGHPSRTACRTRGHQALTLVTALVALLGPLWLLALVPAMAVGLRRPHRTAAVTWAGWVVQGVVALTLAANGDIPSSGQPALLLHPDAPTTLLLCLPLVVVAALAGALATVPPAACRVDEPVEFYAPPAPEPAAGATAPGAIAWPTPNDAGTGR